MQTEKKFKVVFKNGQQTIFKATEFYLDDNSRVWIKVINGARIRAWDIWQVRKVLEI